MGKRGPLKQAPGERKGHSRGRQEGVLIALPNADLDRPVPECPAEIDHPQVRDAWTTYWQSEVARVTIDADREAITRHFRLLQQFYRAMEVTEKAMVVRGSMGQPRINPLAKHAMELHSALQRSENELGLTPMARARLGLTLAEGELTVQQINEMARKGVNGSHAGTPEVTDGITAELLSEYEEEADPGV